MADHDDKNTIGTVSLPATDDDRPAGVLTAYHDCTVEADDPRLKGLAILLSYQLRAELIVYSPAHGLFGARVLAAFAKKHGGKSNLAPRPPEPPGRIH